MITSKLDKMSEMIIELKQKGYNLNYYADIVPEGEDLIIKIPGASSCWLYERLTELENSKK